MRVYVFSFLILFGFLKAVDLASGSPVSSYLSDSLQTLTGGKLSGENTIYKSEDSGLTWREVGEELPEDLHIDGFEGRKMNNDIESGSGLLTARSYGIFKSLDQGKTWKKVYAEGWARKLAKSGDVLMASSQKGILRSTDEGEHWENVMREGGVGIDVEVIEGGFAAITYNTESKTRRVRVTYDSGKTWQAIDAGLPASSMVASIVETNGMFFCGHPDGIFKSVDKGKTWQLVKPSVDSKVFNLSVSGNVVYAVLKAGGC